MEKTPSTRFPAAMRRLTLPVLAAALSRLGSLPSLGPRLWLRILLPNVAGALLAALLLVFLGGRRSLGASLLIALVYANSIGTMAALLLPPLTRRFAGRRLVQWCSLLGALLGLAAVGSLGASLLVTALGLVPAEQFWRLLAFSFRLAAVITLGVGVSMFLYETTRVRLDAATLNLRANELEKTRTAKLLVEARLASLESRLHPHFLFNTLTAITALVPEEPALAERLLVQLAALLRASLNESLHHTVRLGDELALVRAYLEIEQVRLGARLFCAIDIPPELEGCQVPPFSVHTLVENSVTHVAAARREGGELWLAGRLVDGRLVLSVWDNGPGVELAAVAPGHGLDTLRARLAALYGDRAGLEAVREDEGARVVMSLPAPLPRGVRR